MIVHDMISIGWETKYKESQSIQHHIEGRIGMGKAAQISNQRTMMDGSRQTWGQRVRNRIDSTLIVERLQRVALGTEEATQVELNACRMLLDRTLPTIKPVEPTGQGDTNAKTITNDQLFTLIEGESKRIG